MDISIIEKWLSSLDDQINPPGCVSVIVPLPMGRRGYCTVGIVQEHRFAFTYWGAYSHDRNDKPLPTLITLDSHNDIGVKNDVLPADLDNLEIGNKTEMGLFAWLRLRSLNDGHILPALYLNFFADVYVLNKAQDPLIFKTPNSKEQYSDRYGNTHTIAFYRQAEQLLRDLPPDAPVYLDIDLDYFVTNNQQAILGAERLLPDEEIEKILMLKGSFIEPILSRIVGLTIALEPKYCGGLLNSLHLLDVLNRELFDGTLCSQLCRWKTDNQSN